MRTSFSSPRVLRLLPFLLAFFLAGILVVCRSQSLPVGLFREFSLPEYYDPPHETQMKSLLEGVEAVPQDEGRILIRELVLSTFREDGTQAFVLHADDCLYDPNAHSASSAGSLRIETADGQFSTKGRGFLWRQDTSTLTISNQVHTTIRLAESTLQEP